MKNMVKLGLVATLSLFLGKVSAAGGQQAVEAKSRAEAAVGRDDAKAFKAAMIDYWNQSKGTDYHPLFMSGGKIGRYNHAPALFRQALTRGSKDLIKAISELLVEPYGKDYFVQVNRLDLVKMSSAVPSITAKDIQEQIKKLRKVATGSPAKKPSIKETSPDPEAEAMEEAKGKEQAKELPSAETPTFEALERVGGAESEEAKKEAREREEGEQEVAAEAKQIEKQRAMIAEAKKEGQTYEDAPTIPEGGVQPSASQPQGTSAK